MLSPRGQTKIFGLDLGLGLVYIYIYIYIASGLVLVLTKIVLVASLSVIEITSFTLRSSLIGNCCLLYDIELEVNF